MAGIVVTPQPEASETGVEILRRGGNAVDAAVATALVQGGVDPQMCGIAGFGSMQLYLPGQGVHEFIDFHGKTPAAARPDMWEHLIEGETRDGFGFILKGRVNDIGYQSITVPGSLKAYFEAQSAYGRMDWADVVQPAIEACEAGVMIRPHVHFFWTVDEPGRVLTADRLRFTEAGREIYFHPDGRLKGLGETLRNPDLAETLRRIAREGADVFYSGSMAEEIAADMAANGGLLSAQDLRDYRTRRVKPLWGEFRGYRVASNHPPGGGVMLIEMLQILEHFDLEALGHNSVDYIQVVAEAMKQATADKDAFVGDPAFVEVPLERLTSRAYAAEVAARIKAGERGHVERLPEGGLPEPKDTTHVAIVDGEGNAVSMTHSLGMPSGVITKGLGFMYNGCMGVFDPRPGRAGSIAPGKARFSSVCPTIVFKEEEPCLVIGAPGGTQIAMGVLQATLNALAFDMPIDRAIAAPRFSATSDIIDVSNRIPRFVTRALEERGYQTFRSYLSYTFAAVHGLKRGPEGWSGGADPGHDGMPLSV